ncbi:uncharacterized protein JN550_005197 [Neoarthrinium moseri]|uniref:uncharacterized protein n=1 Tax=Neoarthrinium moseri TaxID=1658444 RepID=UPI001FDD3F50|nr:uncharacterized protein JN550_005197 [Neoarthrinium moseri]KAI1870654.1 hypothetical protein JN550_005197 [Neoarthrinium moseri]
MLRAFAADPTGSATSGSRKGCHFVYLEAWTHSDTSGVHTHDFTAAPLDESQIGDWAWQRGAFAPQSAVPGETKKSLEGGLRVLFAQPTSNFRAATPTALFTGRVCEALGLPELTFTSFQQYSGVFSSHTYPEGSSIEECAKLSLIFRTPEKSQLSIGGFAISHDFKTGITTALNVGDAFRLGQYCQEVQSDKSSSPAESAMGALIEQVRECQSLWAHPLLLPCLFLVTHALRVRAYIMGDLTQQVIVVERNVGVTSAGRSRRTVDRSTGASSRSNLTVTVDQGTDDSLYSGDHMQRNSAKRLTRSINDLSTWIIFAQRSPRWDIDCVEFLLGLFDGNGSGSKKRLAGVYRGAAAHTFRETLDYVRNYCESCLEVTQTSEARMQLQLNILYTSIAQDDGQTSARLAASAGKDSTSMKIIALITAAYLPGTFVATLFSMGMFDWQANSSGDDSQQSRHSAVSPDFWIYWAVAVPLTILTLAGWAFWWRVEKQRFIRDFQHAVADRPQRLDKDDSERGKARFLPFTTAL